MTSAATAEKKFCPRGQHFVLATEGKYYKKLKKNGRVYRFFFCNGCSGSVLRGTRPPRKEGGPA